jgi:hypothetical protein
VKLKHIIIPHFLLTFAALLACFIWLGVTNAGNPAGRHGTIVTYKVPVYWILIGFGQMFIAASVYSLISKQPGYVIGRGQSRVLGGSGTADVLLRLIPGLIGLSALIIGVVALSRD